MQCEPISAALLSPAQLSSKISFVPCPTCGNCCQHVPDSDPDHSDWVFFYSECRPENGGCGLNFLYQLVSSQNASQRLEDLAAGIGSSFGPKRSPEASGDVLTGYEVRDVGGYGDVSGFAYIYVHNGVKLGENGQLQAGEGFTSIPESELPKVDCPGVQERISGFAFRKQYAQKVALHMLANGERKRGQRVERCSSNVTLRKWAETGRVEVVDSDWCQCRMLCPNCAKAISGRSLRKMVPKVLQVLDKHPTLVPCLVTLTVKAGGDLKERVDHIFSSLRKATRQVKDSRRGKGKYTQFANMEGAFWHLEIKRGSGSGEWHPHVHGLVMRERDQRWDVDAFREDWKRATGDSHVVNCKVTHFGQLMIANKAPAYSVELTNPGVLVKDLCEILKYSLKFEDSLSPADVLTVDKVCYARHLSRTWGIMRGLKTEERATGETFDSEESGRYLEYVFQWIEEGYRLRGTVAGEVKPPSQRALQRASGFDEAERAG